MLYYTNYYLLFVQIYLNTYRRNVSRTRTEHNWWEMWNFRRETPAQHKDTKPDNKKAVTAQNYLKDQVICWWHNFAQEISILHIIYGFPHHSKGLAAWNLKFVFIPLHITLFIAFFTILPPIIFKNLLLFCHMLEIGQIFQEKNGIQN